MKIIITWWYEGKLKINLKLSLLLSFDLRARRMRRTTQLVAIRSRRLLGDWSLRQNVNI